MTREQLFAQINTKKTFLCVGLDTDIQKIPVHLKNEKDPVFEFNKQIIDATHDLCVAYKPNTAFYESQGSTGWISLEKTMEYIRKNYPHHFTIADAKRGDIGNTSKMYASAFFERMDFHAVTVAPYMGSDSVKPFLEYPGKWVILLALTSNEGAFDFQLQRVLDEDDAENSLYERVISIAQTWGNADNMMFVTGATKTEYLKHIRDLVPQHFFLIPGVGAQGGSLDGVSRTAMNKQCGVLVNSSRDILYASGKEDFAQKAREKALMIQTDMKMYLIHL